MKKVLLVLGALLVFSGCSPPKTPTESATPPTVENSPETTTLTSPDGIPLKAVFRVAQGEAPVLLVHQYGSNKEEWAPFAEEIQGMGFPSLAIDLRGHGESGGGSYEDFTSAQWARVKNDVAAGMDWLKARYPGQKPLVMGSSIGSSVVLAYLSEHPDSARAVVLISPGLDYRDIQTLSLIQKLSLPILALASAKDTPSADALAKFDQAGPADFQPLICEDLALHGVKMLQECKPARTATLEFLRDHSGGTSQVP